MAIKTPDIDVSRPGERPGAVDHPRMVIATTILASSLAFIDGSVVNVGLPAIGEDLQAGGGELQWIVSAYLLPLSALLLLGGAAGDRYGRRHMLVFGSALFALASLACAAAPSFKWLLTARFVQGASAAMLMPNSLAILGQTFSGAAKGKAVGIWAATGAGAGAFGPVLGGWLIDVSGWRLIFLLNVPIAAAAILFAWTYVPRDRPDNRENLDGWGALLATVGLGLSTWALTEISSRGWSAVAIGALTAGLAVLVAFVLVEKYLGNRAMMPLALFGSSSFVGLTMLTLLLYGALGGLLVLVPYLLIVGQGYSATQAGAALLPLPLVIALASPGIGGFAGKAGAKIPLIVGPVVVGFGFLLALRITAGHGFWTDVMPAMVVIALGMAGAVTPLTTAVLSSVDSKHTGSASGYNSAVARTGGLLATAFLGPALAATGSSLSSAFEVAMMIGAVVCLASSASALLLKNYKARS